MRPTIYVATRMFELYQQDDQESSRRCVKRVRSLWAMGYAGFCANICTTMITPPPRMLANVGTIEVQDFLIGLIKYFNCFCYSLEDSDDPFILRQIEEARFQNIPVFNTLTGANAWVVNYYQERVAQTHIGL
jgi:hypothetical protein